MAIYERILEWADRLPSWRQDALRRLCAQGALTEADLDEILDLAKQHHGIISSFEAAPQPIPFAADHFPAEADQDRTVVLKSLHTLTNVGKIPSDQVLEFKAQGLTIVYGGNGAGKSGYARVLKQACRSRSPGTVYPNAYSPDYRQLTPSATIEFELNGATEHTIWSGHRGHFTRPELRGISVFDGDCARHYLQSREVATFQPPALTYLEQLASGLNKALRPRLQAEIAGLAADVSPFNVIPADTDAGQAVHPIGPTTDLTRARALATLMQEEQAELTRLPKEISEADPTNKAINLDNAATRVDELASSIAAAADIVSDEALDARQLAHRNLVEAEAAEREASALLQAEDATQLLPGTGQGPWAALFKAARAYSTSMAYPGQAFPVTDEGAVCVLCQHELTTEAKDRLERFDRFIRDKAAEAGQAARTAWQKIVSSVDQVNVVVSVSSVMSESLDKRVAGLPDQFSCFQEDLTTRLQWLRAAVHTGEWQHRPAYRGPEPTASLRIVADGLRAEAARLRTNLDAASLATKRQRLKELEARLLLSVHIETIARVSQNLALKAKLGRCLDDIGNMRAISTIAGQLAKTYVSEALAAEMNNELSSLDLYHVRAGVSSSGDVGAVRLGIKLEACELDPHLVLSEAEQRICALAYFFAELQESGSSSGIVFDDPVSSLDHNHRSAVARRIVQESINRQVIVFTHDAVFFGELVSFSQDAQVEPEVRSINYRAEGPGYIDAGLPQDMRKYRERIAYHRADHKRIAASFNNPPGDEERLAMRNAYDDLRVTIEVGIEDTILNETVVRFRDGIKVGNLSGVMTVQDDDYREVQRLHGRCCRNVRAHSHAAGQQRPVPQPGELMQDIDDVYELFKSINKRRG